MKFIKNILAVIAVCFATLSANAQTEIAPLYKFIGRSYTEIVALCKQGSVKFEEGQNGAGRLQIEVYLEDPGTGALSEIHFVTFTDNGTSKNERMCDIEYVALRHLTNAELNNLKRYLNNMGGYEKTNYQTDSGLPVGRSKKSDDHSIEHYLTIEEHTTLGDEDITLLTFYTTTADFKEK